MDVAEDIAQKALIEKVMLTCFLSNGKAHSFYEKRGYVADACSPEDRVTRNKVVKPDYVIMSKGVPGSSVQFAMKGEGFDDVRVGLQNGVERTATDSAPIDITERRLKWRYQGQTSVAESTLSNQQTVCMSSSKSSTSNKVAAHDKENLHAASY